MLVAPYNDLIVKVDRKFNDEIQLKGGKILYQATQFNPGEHANVIADVVTVPKEIEKSHQYEGFSLEGIEPGDKAIVRYDLVYFYSAQPDRDTNRHKFEIIYKGESFWRCNIHKVFGVIKPNGDVVMLNGYVMLYPFVIAKTLHVPGHLKQYTRAMSSIVMHIGKPLKGQKKIPVKAGHQIWFNPRVAQHYKAGEKEYVIIKQKNILGIEPA